MLCFAQPTCETMIIDSDILNNNNKKILIQTELIQMKRLFKENQQKIKNNKQNINLLLNRDIQFSDEQQQYIKDPFWQHKQDTILIACAGSGKTKSMIDKIRYLASSQIYNKKQIMVFSYSKLTIEHTKNCFKQCNDYNIFSDDKLIKTIDAFCYDILKKIDPDSETCAIQVLSSKFLDISVKQPEMLSKRIKSSKYGKIKVLFVDEAQDLNQTQYDIILFIQKLTGCILHLIGDPNQNIYQFRGSFEKYILNHPGKKFYLTKNFRCQGNIEQFSNFFKYYEHTNTIQNKQTNIQDKSALQASQVKSFNDLVERPKGDSDPEMVVNSFEQKMSDNQLDIINTQQSHQLTTGFVDIVMGSYNKNDEMILQIIQTLTNQGYSYNNIGILSPIVGDQFGSGIKRIANLFDKVNIPYVSYYSELKDDQQKKVKIKKKVNGVNLLTIHGSKGLEYPVIILLKLQDKMMFQEQLQQEYFVSQNMNLIYVALTRAMQKLIIIQDEQPNIQHKHICSILYSIPQHLYSSNGDIDRHLKVIQQKLDNRQKICDENVNFISNHTINNKKDIMLVTKRLMPELFDMTQKEVMYTNSLFSWKTSVSRFIQNISQETMLEILENLSFKKKSNDIYTVPDKQQQLFKTIRTEHEAFIGVLFESIIFYQIQWEKSHRSSNIEIKEIPKIQGLVFTLKESIPKSNQLLHINEFFVVYNYEQLKSIISIYNHIKETEDITQKDINNLLHDFQQKIIQQQSVQSSHKNTFPTNQLIYFETLDFGTISSTQIILLEQNQQYIFEHINIYNQSLSWEISLDSLIYMSMLKFSTKSKHAKYIKYDKQFIQKIKEFTPILNTIHNTISKPLSLENIQYQYEVGTDDIIGFIDFLIVGKDENTIIELKVVNETNTEHILQLLLYNYLLEIDQQKSLNNRLIIINALKGVQYEILIEQKQIIYNLIGNLLNQDQINRCNYSCQ